MFKDLASIAVTLTFLFCSHATAQVAIQNSNSNAETEAETQAAPVPAVITHVTDKKMKLTSLSRARVCGREANGKTDVCFPELPLLSKSMGPASDLVVSSATACAREQSGAWICWGLPTPRLQTVVDRIVGQSDVNQTPFALGDNLCTVGNKILACTTYTNYPHGYLPSPNSGAASNRSKIQRFGPFKNLRAVNGSKSYLCVIDGETVQCQSASASSLKLPRNFVHPKLVAATSFSVCVIDDQGLNCFSDSLYDNLKSHPDWKDAKLIRSHDQGVCVLRISGKIECEAGAYINAPQFEIPLDLEPSSDFVLGQAHGCALSTNKKVRCWGLKSLPDLITVPAFSSPVLKIGSGDRHTCALLESGEVRCWGDASEPQLRVPAISGADLKVATGKNVSCVYGASVNAKGLSCEAVAWGWQTPPDLKHILTVAVPPTSGDTACALEQTSPLGTNEKKLETSVKCWGLTTLITEVPETIRNPKLVSVASDFACAATETDVQCWGRDEAIQTSYPDRLQSPRKLVTAFKHACALDDFGLACWGTLQRDFGLDLRVPGLYEGRNAATDIAIGDRHSCVLTPTKQVKCWGDNSLGQLDVPPLEDPSSIAAAGSLTCASDNKGVTCWGEAFNPETPKTENAPNRTPYDRVRNSKARHI